MMVNEMKSSPKITVIVPVYNVEKYLHRCLDSIIQQTFNDIEILLVNDGSTDQSGHICDEYQAKDSRIKVFHKTNEGISATREYAVHLAKGDYIQFVDSDDWIDLDMLERLYNVAQNNEADIVACNFIEEYGDQSVRISAITDNLQTFTRMVVSSYWGVLWKLLIKRELFHKGNIHFPKGIDGGEDYFVVTSLLLEADTIAFEDIYPYHYFRGNEHSFIATPSLEKLIFQVRATELVENKLQTHNLLYLYQSELNLRKCYTKLGVLRCSFWDGVYLFPELNVKDMRKVSGVRSKLLLIASYIINRLVK